MSLSKMSDSGILSFIPYYPNIKDKNFIGKVTQKKEFYDLRLGPRETVQQGEALTHQKFAQLFFSPHTQYDKGLLFQGLGSGKTCTAALVVENYHQSLKNQQPPKRALIFVKGDDLMRNFKREIAYVCTHGKYVPKETQKEKILEEDLSEEKRVRRLNDAIAQTYEIVKIETFLRNLPSNEILKRDYSDRIIIIDEAHHLRLQPKKKQKTNLKDEKIENIDLYQRMHHFLHIIHSPKVLLLTATPIWDKANEIATLMNLILPLDEQMPIKKEFNKEFFDKDGNLKNEEKLRNYLRGRVSFLRPLSTTARKEVQGITKPFLQYIKVYPDIMSDFQAKYAEKAWKETAKRNIKIKGKIKEREIKGGTILKLARDAAVFVFPVFNDRDEVVGGTYGMDAFRENCVKTRKTTVNGELTEINVYGFKDQRLIAELRENLWKYSAKIASIIDIIINHPNEVVFIFTEFVTGAGAILIGLCLQLFGFKWAKKASDIQKPSTPETEGRFAVLTSDPQTTSQPKQIQDLLDKANSPENRYGGHLRIIIGSEKISEGVTIKHVRQAHDVIPPWNIPSEDQANGRFARFGSHDAFDNEDEKYTRIYRHIAVKEGDKKKGIGYPQNKGISSDKTIDVYVYEMAEGKDRKNTQLYRELKKIAYDCALNYPRNVLESDKDGTKECDYQECNYICEGTKPNQKGKVWSYDVKEKNLDKSTYNLFYANDKLRYIVEKIREIFGVDFSLHLDDLKRKIKIPDDEEFLLLRAIDEMINRRVSINNRFGFPCYLKEEGDIIFLDYSTNPLSNYFNNTYVKHLLITDRSNFSSSIQILELGQDKEIVEKFCASQEGFDGLSYVSKIMLFEVSYAEKFHVDNFSKKLNKKALKLIDRIIKDFEDKIYMFDETPIHILYTQEFTGSSYDVSAKEVTVTGLMRKFNKKKGEWEYLSHQEETKYVGMIKNIEKTSREKCLENNPYGVCGWISKKDNKFRLNLKREEGDIRGRVCSTFNIPILLEIFYNLKYLPEPDEKYEDIPQKSLVVNIENHPRFIKMLEDKIPFKPLDEMSEDEMRRFLTLLSMEKNNYCSLLEDILNQKGLLEEK